jgi:hypothetical protein
MSGAAFGVICELGSGGDEVRMQLELSGAYCRHTRTVHLELVAVLRLRRGREEKSCEESDYRSDQHCFSRMVFEVSKTENLVTDFNPDKYTRDYFSVVHRLTTTGDVRLSAPRRSSSFEIWKSTSFPHLHR